MADIRIPLFMAERDTHDRVALEAVDASFTLVSIDAATGARVSFDDAGGLEIWITDTPKDARMAVEAAGAVAWPQMFVSHATTACGHGLVLFQDLTGMPEGPRVLDKRSPHPVPDNVQGSWEMTADAFHDTPRLKQSETRIAGAIAALAVELGERVGRDALISVQNAIELYPGANVSFLGRAIDDLLDQDGESLTGMFEVDAGEMDKRKADVHAAILQAARKYEGGLAMDGVDASVDHELEQAGFGIEPDQMELWHDEP